MKSCCSNKLKEGKCCEPLFAINIMLLLQRSRMKLIWSLSCWLYLVKIMHDEKTRSAIATTWWLSYYLVSAWFLLFIRTYPIIFVLSWFYLQRAAPSDSRRRCCGRWWWSWVVDCGIIIAGRRMRVAAANIMYILWWARGGIIRQDWEEQNNKCKRTAAALWRGGANRPNACIEVARRKQVWFFDEVVVVVVVVGDRLTLCSSSADARDQLLCASRMCVLIVCSA